jgi:hypothetical protein
MKFQNKSPCGLFSYRHLVLTKYGRYYQILATPLFRAASATALATASLTRGSNAAGMM